MGTPKCCYADNERAALGVNSVVHDRAYSVHPYNSHDGYRTSTEWWIHPPLRGKDKRSYRYAKHFFATAEAEDDRHPMLFTGFCVEKGYSPGIPGLDPAYVLNDIWYWKRALSEASSGAYDHVMSTVLARTGCPVWIYLNIYPMNQPPNHDLHRPPPYDCVKQKITDGSLEFQLVRPASKELRALNSSQNLRELGHSLAEMKDLGFFWINFLVGVRLEYSDGEFGSWGPRELWDNALQPWDRFVDSNS
ncbi:MAG: hypothetical protein ACJ8C4_16415 [Gemmataceae bacterium]